MGFFFPIASQCLVQTVIDVIQEISFLALSENMVCRAFKLILPFTRLVTTLMLLQILLSTRVCLINITTVKLVLFGVLPQELSVSNSTRKSETGSCKKRIFVRIEHVQKSKCREHFLTRVK